MDAGELRNLLAGAEETANLEFKGPMDWNPTSIAKDILAMANTIDGGRIVFGITDETLEQVGLSQAQFDTFDPEEMQDQIEPFADPGVAFRVFKIVDEQNLRFIVVEVFPFDDLPVICKRDKGDLAAGALYYRPRTGRPKSRKIASSTEMRELVDRAIASNVARFRRIGLLPAEEVLGAEPVERAQFDQEAADLL